MSRTGHHGCVREEDLPGGEGEFVAVPGLDPGAGGGPRDASLTPELRELRRPGDGTTWQIGGSGEVAWIAADTQPDGTVAAAIPPVFDAYAIVPVPETDEDKRLSDEALVALLRAQASQQPWWLGYLETGVAELVIPDAPRVRLYCGWPYVLIKAGPDQAGSWRTNDDATPWHSALPELIFPFDHSWLVSTLWDDDWKCLGGPRSLVESVVRHPRLHARGVALDEQVTPSGDEHP